MFTFKNSPRSTGLARIGEANSCSIKIKKKEVGSISDGGWRNTSGDYSIMLMVKNAENSSGFKWITLKYRGETMEITREWLKENYEAITTKYDLFHRDIK